MNGHKWLANQIQIGRIHMIQESVPYWEKPKAQVTLSTMMLP